MGGTRGGRPAKVTALRVLEGNREHRPLPKGEPQAQAGVPVMPESVMADPVALKKWNWCVEVLGFVPGWITTEMATLLERYALTYSQMIRCEQYVAKNGDTFEAEFIHKDEDDREILVKSRKRHPETVILKECRAELLKIEAAIGMGPVYRTKVNLLVGKQNDHSDLYE